MLIIFNAFFNFRKLCLLGTNLFSLIIIIIYQILVIPLILEFLFYLLQSYLLRVDIKIIITTRLLRSALIIIYKLLIDLLIILIKHIVFLQIIDPLIIFIVTGLILRLTISYYIILIFNLLL